MKYDLFSSTFDLVTPDGVITSIESQTEDELIVHVEIGEISAAFVGFRCEKEDILFNLKSSLAQLGIESEAQNIELSPNLHKAQIKLRLFPLSPLGKTLLPLLEIGTYVGKLFAARKSRRVRDPDYLLRMFDRSDRNGHPLLSLGGSQQSGDLRLEKINDHTIAFLKLKPGTINYRPQIEGLLPTVAQGLKNPRLSFRNLVALHQYEKTDEKRLVKKNALLLVKTPPLHIRTAFGRVIPEHLPPGFHHTQADILQPDTFASGDVYEFYGESASEITEIPLEFYTLEPYREHVFFSDRDQLKDCLREEKALFDAFNTMPTPTHHKCATFVVKGEQLLNLTPSDWISIDTEQTPFPGITHLDKQATLVQNYIEEQPSYPFLKAIQKDHITSQGILLSRYLPTPLMKRMLITEQIDRCLKGIYFQIPSREGGEYFSHEDRSLLLDIVKFGIPIFWADQRTGRLLQFIPKPLKDTGMFVPQEHIETFVKATMIGIYGSNLIEGHFETELKQLIRGLLDLKKETTHPLLNPTTPLALVTGGGPGAMLIGNKVAQEEKILSCANIVDFSSRNQLVINEQKQNPYLDAKMTYRLDRLVERQAEFNLDLPIILMGGIGSDFEHLLEEVRRKTGITTPTPVLLFGPPSYWRSKITSRFQQNLTSGTIKGSEWVSNCFYVVQDAAAGLRIYHQFFAGQLPIGKSGPIYEDGFAIPSSPL